MAFKNLPIDRIPVKLCERISELLYRLKIYGIFVPIGELEQWLGNIRYNEPDKPFTKMLNKIKQTKPTPDDIWQFIDDINIFSLSV
jgi:hypothetical protein